MEFQTYKAPDIPADRYFEVADLPEFQRRVEARNWYPGLTAELFDSPIVYVRSYYDRKFPRQFVFPKGSCLVIPGDWELKLKPITKAPFVHMFGSRSHGVHCTGADPEIFVVDGAKRLLPAFRFLPEKEKAPEHTDYIPGRNYIAGKTYWDGFQAEFTITPLTCHGYLIDNIRAGLKTVLQEARKLNPKATLTLKNVFRLSPDMLMQASPEHVALGCQPSSNAYNTEPFVVENPRDFPYRVAGGHIHFAKAQVRTNVINIVKGLDLLVALPAVGIFASIDNPIRRQFYGRAGEYRTPAYGLEYRTLSNAWLGDPAVAHLILQLARRALALGDIPVPYEEVGASEEQVRDIINNCDVKAARTLIEKNRAFYSTVFSTAHFAGTKSVPSLFKIIFEGVEALLPNYHNIEKNWKLMDKWKMHSDNSHKMWTVAANRPSYGA